MHEQTCEEHPSYRLLLKHVRPELAGRTTRLSERAPEVRCFDPVPLYSKRGSTNPRPFFRSCTVLHYSYIRTKYPQIFVGKALRVIVRNGPITADVKQCLALWILVHIILETMSAYRHMHGLPRTTCGCET